MLAIKPPKADTQVEFYKRLLQLENVMLLEALLATVGQLNIPDIDRELSVSTPLSTLQRLASWGLRGELVFPVPSVLRANPHLLGYYRLLLGASQKQFYTSASGLSKFKSLETRGIVPPALDPEVPTLCKALGSSLDGLVQGVNTLNASSIHDLTLLTLGPQFRGGKLNALGAQATQKVFDLIGYHIRPAVTASSAQKIELRNAAGRVVLVEFAADPDITIREVLPSGASRNLVAIEIKGGRDVSNIHNRLGEAEKSHQKARQDGFTECWTITGVPKLDLKLAKKEASSTDRFFNLDGISDELSENYAEFREQLLALVGLST